MGMMRMGRPLDNPVNWSFRVGRLAGIDIRVHIAFVIFAVVLLGMELPKTGADDPRTTVRILIDVFGIYAILFLVVLLHEFGHCFGARRAGGEADEVLLWPLGGLALADVPHNPTAHMITTVAGPMVNVVFCTLGSAGLVLWIGELGAVPWNPLHPFSPVSASVLPTEGQLWLMRFFGINYILLLFNLLPIYPFDGGRILQAWLWRRKGYRASMELATGTGMVGAILLGLFGLFTGQDWLLLMIAVFGYINCWYARRMLQEEATFDTGGFGYEFSKDDTGLDREAGKKPGFFARRRARLSAIQQEQQRRHEARQQADVEAVLRKVSESGMESLSRRQRQILEQETQRQRAFEAGPQSADRSG